MRFASLTDAMNAVRMLAGGTAAKLISSAQQLFQYADELSALGVGANRDAQELVDARRLEVVHQDGAVAQRQFACIVHISVAGAQTLGKVASILAHGEGLQAHARSAEMRLRG